MERYYCFKQKHAFLAYDVSDLYRDLEFLWIDYVPECVFRGPVWLILRNLWKIALSYVYNNCASVTCSRIPRWSKRASCFYDDIFEWCLLIDTFRLCILAKREIRLYMFATVSNDFFRYVYLVDSRLDSGYKNSG